MRDTVRVIESVNIRNYTVERSGNDVHPRTLTDGRDQFEMRFVQEAKFLPIVTTYKTDSDPIHRAAARKPSIRNEADAAPLQWFVRPIRGVLVLVAELYMRAHLILLGFECLQLWQRGHC